MSDTLIGVSVMLASTSAMNVGCVIQKKAVDGLPPLEDLPALQSLKAVLGTPLWLLGWLLTSGAIVLNWVALGFADMSIVQPLNGFGLVVLALFSRAFLGERLTPRTLAGIAATIAGLVIIGLSASESRSWEQVAQVHACYTRPQGLATLAGLGALIAIGWIAAGRLRRGAGVLFAGIAAASSVLGLTCAKGLFVGFGLEGVWTSLGSWPSYALGVPLLLCSTLAIVLQQLSFQKGRAVVVTPVFGAASVALPLFVGHLVFDEPLAPTLGLAVGCIVGGVALLGGSSGTDMEAPPGISP